MKEYKGMNKKNCWEFTKCGREPEGCNASKFGICPVSTFTIADGFCEGKNGGRACSHISKALDLEPVNGNKTPIVDGLFKKKINRCESCDFYNELKNEYGKNFSLLSFKEYIAKHKK